MDLCLCFLIQLTLLVINISLNIIKIILVKNNMILYLRIIGNLNLLDYLVSDVKDLFEVHYLISETFYLKYHLNITYFIYLPRFIYNIYFI